MRNYLLAEKLKLKMSSVGRGAKKPAKTATHDAITDADESLASRVVRYERDSWYRKMPIGDEPINLTQLVAVASIAATM